MIRRESALHNPRPDAMAEEFAGREQSSRTGPHDQDGRCGCGPMIFTKSFVERDASVANARIDVGRCLCIPVGPTEHMPSGSGRLRSSPAIARIAKSSPIDIGIVNLRGCDDILPWVQGLRTQPLIRVYSDLATKRGVIPISKAPAYSAPPLRWRGCDGLLSTGSRANIRFLPTRSPSGGDQERSPMGRLPRFHRDR